MSFVRIVSRGSMVNHAIPRVGLCKESFGGLPAMEGLLCFCSVSQDGLIEAIPSSSNRTLLVHSCPYS